MYDEKDESTKKGIALILAVIIVIAGLFVLWSPSIGGEQKYPYETGIATLDDLLNSESQRGVINVTLLVSDDSPYYALIGTPVSLYYEKGISNATAKPMLVWLNHRPTDYPQSAVVKFLTLYGNPEVFTIGDLWGLEYEGINVGDGISEPTLKETSLAVAEYFWESSDGVVIVKEDQNGYNYAVMAVPLASYLNIPVIVTDKTDKTVAETLNALGVKYSIVCGDVGGYGKTMRFASGDDWDDIIDIMISMIRERLNADVEYITMANPADIIDISEHVVETIKYHFEGVITNSDSAAYPGAAPALDEDSPIEYFDIPDDYEYANVKFSLRMDTRGEKWGDASGARIYAYIGIDGDEDGYIDEASEADKLQFFGGSPAYERKIGAETGYHGEINEYVHFYTELPFFHDNGTHAAQLMAKLPTDYGKSYIMAEDGDYETNYTLDITVEKLDTSTYPLMKDLSSFAPYLTAFRKGVVMAKLRYQLYDAAGYIGCKDCGDPASNADLIEVSNEHTVKIKKDLNRILGKLADMPAESNDDIIALAEYYAEREVPIHVGIIADTNMLPQFYYESSGQGDATEGFGIPGDNIYADIDADPEDPPYDLDGNPSMELAVGRVVGWNTEEVSALLARTFFYSEIIDNYKGPKNGGELPEWKNSGLVTFGTAPPVGGAVTATEKMQKMWEYAGFTVNSLAPVVDNFENYYLMSGRQTAGPYYQSSNFIFFCAHGFYYWYVPTAQIGNPFILPRPTVMPPVYGGQAFDVMHVKHMDFGPSVIFGSSCVTGRIDGLYPYNALSLAFSHAGINAYIGATRLSWGSIIPIPDEESGEKFGNLLAVYMYGHLVGNVYDKSNDNFLEYLPEDTSIGHALMLAKNEYIESEGSDNGGPHDDTLNEFQLVGDPAFNPYEPNHEGSR